MYKHFKQDPKGEEKKLTDEKIIKALECCAVEPCEDCGNCPRFTKEKLCHKANAKQSLDLINRQKAEIERLTESYPVNSCMRKGCYCSICEKKNSCDECRKCDNCITSAPCKMFRVDVQKFARTIEQNSELQKQVDELKKYAEDIYKKAVDREEDAYSLGFDKGKEQAVKDTAKEILIAVQKKITHLRANGHLGREQDIRLSRFLVGKAQDYGVEVE